MTLETKTEQGQPNFWDTDLENIAPVTSRLGVQNICESHLTESGYSILPARDLRVAEQGYDFRERYVWDKYKKIAQQQNKK